MDMSLNDNSLSIESIISSLAPKDNQSKEYYYCPKCSKIPKIQFDGKYVLIECCGTKKPMKTQQDEDVTNLDILNQFAEFKEYKLHIASYNKITVLNGKRPKICELKLNHSNDQNV